jgi:Capsule assembly protein Wzi
MKRYSIPFLLILFSISNNSFCQRETFYHYDINTVLGSESTPFWMRANIYGAVPTKGQTLAIFGGLVSDYQKTDKKIKIGYGLNIGGFLGMQDKFIAQEAYIKAKWRAFEFYAGRRKEIQGLVDTTLSSGSYIWSGNAIPMPKIDLSIPQYTSIGKSGIFSIKGNYAHGWFDQNRDGTKGVFLHQKSFYIRLGMPNYKIKFYGGFNHQAQWGRLQLNSNSIKSQSSLKDYLNIIMGKSNVGEDTTGLDPNSAGNRTGNHLGSLDTGIEFKLPKSKILFYRQSIFEDGSLFYLNNITDGLHGISITFDKSIKKNINIAKLNFEFLSTLSQGGTLGSEGGIAASRRGRDNYFNNGDFPEGWSYNKTSIGTPFILTKNEHKQTQITNKSTLLFTNNRVQAYIIGFSGAINGKHFFESKVSFSKNWGTYSYGFANPVEQNSFYLKTNSDLDRILGGINIYVIVAGDVGTLLTQNFAAQIGFRKYFNSTAILHPTHRHRLNH